MRVPICRTYLSKATWKGGGGHNFGEGIFNPDIKILVVLKSCASRYQISGKGSLRNFKPFELACDFTGERKTQTDDSRGCNQWDLLALEEGSSFFLRNFFLRFWFVGN